MTTREESKVEDASEYEDVISTYCQNEPVKALIMLKVDTKFAETVATKISDFPFTEDVYLVTGDTDIVIKIRFGTYKELKDFIIGSLGTIVGVKDTETTMIITTFKERGNKKVE